jgi:hypothetical protein
LLIAGQWKLFSPHGLSCSQRIYDIFDLTPAIWKAENVGRKCAFQAVICQNAAGNLSVVERSPLDGICL